MDIRDDLDDQGYVCVRLGHHMTSVGSDGLCDFCGQR